MGDPDRGNWFSAWFLFGSGEAAELHTSPTPLSICPSVGGPVLRLGSEFASCLFNEEWLPPLKPLLQRPSFPLPHTAIVAAIAGAVYDRFSQWFFWTNDSRQELFTSL